MNNYVLTIVSNGYENMTIKSAVNDICAHYAENGYMPWDMKRDAIEAIQQANAGLNNEAASFACKVSAQLMLK